MSASGFDVHVTHYVGRSTVRLIDARGTQLCWKRAAGTQAAVSGNDILASWKYRDEREIKSPKVRVQWQRL